MGTECGSCVNARRGCALPGLERGRRWTWACRGVVGVVDWDGVVWCACAEPKTSGEVAVGMSEVCWRVATGTRAGDGDGVSGDKRYCTVVERVKKDWEALTKRLDRWKGRVSRSRARRTESAIEDGDGARRDQASEVARYQREGRGCSDKRFAQRFGNEGEQLKY